jgi:hypothetical protein
MPTFKKKNRMVYGLIKITKGFFIFTLKRLITRPSKKVMPVVPFPPVLYPSS